MKSNWVEIFKTGTHRGIDFTPVDLKVMEKNYKPEVLEAPLTLDHEYSGQAYGWVEQLKATGRSLFAKFKDVSEELKELVNTRKYPKRSIEIFRDTEKDEWNLRAVSFLGAKSPAVKGMPDFQFADTIGSKRFTLSFAENSEQEEKELTDIKPDNSFWDGFFNLFAKEKKTENKDKDQEFVMFAEKVKELENKVQTFEAEKKKLEDEKESLNTKLLEFENEEHQRKKERDFLTFEKELIESGKVLPAEIQVETGEYNFEGFAKSLDDEQREFLKAFLQSRKPSMNFQSETPKESQIAEFKKPYSELDYIAQRELVLAEIRKYQAENPEVSFTDAKSVVEQKLKIGGK